MNTHQIVLAATLAGSAIGVCAQNTTDNPKALERDKNVKPRNIIFILTDDHRHDFMGFTGKVPWLETPNMDRMAAEGAHFKNAFVTTSLSSPSRASILTGMFSHTHTIVDNQAPDPGHLTYFPQYLKGAGYQTAFFGKWHMGDDSDTPRPGFTHWESFRGQGVYYNPVLNINGQKVAYKDSTYITDLLTEHTLKWLQERDKSKPFFVYLSHKAVHAEFMPAKRHKGRYKDKTYQLPITYAQTKTGAWRDLKWPEWVASQRISWHGVDYMYNSNSELNTMVQDYCETLLGVDESIGSVMDYLKREGLDESTLVIYMGDNGFSWGEHGLIDKRHFYEESVKVPFLVRCPELFKGGTTIEKMVQNIDVAPTCLELAGLKKPAYMPGYSFIQLLKGNETNWRERIFYEYYWEYEFPMTPTMFGVRTDKYKYIRYHGIWDRNEFYDIQNDPNEMYNLIDKPELQAEIRKHLDSLNEWLEKTDGLQIPLKKNTNIRNTDFKHQNQY
ncbi:MAG TPA: sulfatase [Prolixibacteraceae bacterium]|nr:sulfatase [Prolixibacteraceae bacterium]